MNVCLVCSEIFAWGKYGGFGRSTRMLGRELARRGLRVSAVVPRRPGQSERELLDGIQVLGFDPARPWESMGLFREVRASIYHSQEASLGTWFAQRAAPAARHVVSFRDHKFLGDWLVELRHPSRSRLRTLAAALYERNPLVRSAIRRADYRICVSPHLQEPVQRLYGLPQLPPFVGSPVQMPVHPAVKAGRPLVLLLGRLDPRKRPERFIALASLFPEVEFVLAGRAQSEAFEAALRDRAAGLRNVSFAGFLQQFDSPGLEDLLDRAWILVNCSTREGLPTSAVEAWAHGCAVLSEVDVTGWVSRFGRHVTDGDLAGGLRFLLDGDCWRERGSLGRAFVRQHFALDGVVSAHVSLYEALLGGTTP